MLLHKDIPGIVFHGGWHLRLWRGIFPSHMWVELTRHGVVYETADSRFYRERDWFYRSNGWRAHVTYTPQQLERILGAPTLAEATDEQRARLDRRIVSDMLVALEEDGWRRGVPVACGVCGKRALPPSWRPVRFDADEMMLVVTRCTCPMEERIGAIVAWRTEQRERLEREPQQTWRGE